MNELFSCVGIELLCAQIRQLDALVRQRLFPIPIGRAIPNQF